MAEASLGNIQEEVSCLVYRCCFEVHLILPLYQRSPVLEDKKIGLFGKGIWDDMLGNPGAHDYSLPVMAENPVYDIGYQRCRREGITIQVVP